MLIQVRDLLKVEWVEGDPARGVEYVYLSDEDYQRVHASVKAAARTAPDGGWAYASWSGFTGCGTSWFVGLTHAQPATC